MKKLLLATVVLMVSASAYKVSAQQDMAAQGDHRGPPPNVTQAISLLDQAKQQSTGQAASLINQAEALLKQPPPQHQGGMGQNNMSQGRQGGTTTGQGQMQGPPPQQ